MIKSVSYLILGTSPDGGLPEMALLAKKYGYGGFEASAGEIEAYGVENTRKLLMDTGLTITGFALPFKPIDCSDEEFGRNIAELQPQAEIMDAVGCRVCWTFVRSGGDLPYQENYQRHIGRLKEIYGVLDANNISLALEFIGSKTSVLKKPYPFIRTAEELLKLCEDVGDHCGLLFDFWHWYSGSADREVFDHIEGAGRIYLVHLNDAAPGNMDELPDKPRRLVGTSGIIDTAFLISKLKEYGYEGPVISESFDPVLSGLSLEEKLKLVSETIDAAIA